MMSIVFVSRSTLVAPATMLSRWAPRNPAEGVFLSCMVVLWLHFIDATVVHPQAGAGAVEHCVQAVVAFGFPPLAVAAYNTRGRYVRGLGAIAAGLPAFAAGLAIHAVGIAKNGHANPDDFSGLAMGVAGLALVALGIGTIVRAVPGVRRRLGLVLVGPFAFYWVALPVVGGTYIAHAPRYEPRNFDMGAPHEDVAFTTSDGRRIHGSYVPSKNGAAVIVTHGSGGARHRPVEHERMLVRNGYGVLAIDSRGHGESEGTTNALGWGAYPDVAAAARFLAQRPDVVPGQVGVLGISMGAEVALDAAAHGAPISAVVSDGAGGRSINESLSLKRSWKDIVGLPTVFAMDAMVTVLTGTLPPESLESSVQRIVAPTYFISSRNVTEERELNRIWAQRASAVHSTWEVDAGHTAGLEKYPEQYERNVVAFFDRYLLGR